MDLLGNQQARALSKSSPSSLSWRAISSLYKDITGRNVDGRILYTEFKRKYEPNKPAYDKFVSNFDENGITLNTGEDDLEGGDDTNNAQKTVDRTAKRASQKLLKK